MADETPISVTDTDVRDPNLLLRFSRKVVSRLSDITNRLGSLERTPPPASPQQLKQEFQASGSAPINVTGLPGLLAQPQYALAVVYTSAPSGLILQQLKDGQLILVGSSSTGYSLQRVVGGNPNSLYILVNGLSSGNFMTLDTVQTATGDKTLQGLWTFVAPVLAGGGSAATPGWAFTTSTNSGIYSTSTGTLSLSANGNQVFLLSSGQAKLPSSKITQYNGVTTTAEGVPYIIARDTVINQSSSKASTTLYTTTTTGEYRFSYYIETITSGTNNVALTYGYTNDAGGQAFTALTMALLVGGVQQDMFLLRSAAGQAISYNILWTTTTLGGSTGAYSSFVLLERLS